MGLLDRIQDSFKYLDKNGLKKVLTLVKNHDRHWTGTHAEYEAVKDTLPAYTILHFTDDYDDGYGAPFSKSYINTGAHAYGDEVLASTNVYDAVEELCREWKTKSDAERRAFACTGQITLTNGDGDGDTRIPGVCGTYLITTQRGTATGTNFFVRLEIWNNPNTFATGGQTILAATLTQMGIFNCDYSIINQPYSTSEVRTGRYWTDGKPTYQKSYVMTNTSSTAVSLQVPHGITNLDKVIGWTGTTMAKAGASNVKCQRMLPFTYYGDANWTVGVTVNDNSSNRTLLAQLGASAAAEVGTLYITLEYTKTTD